MPNQFSNIDPWDRIRAKTVKDGECLLWTGKRDRDGYATFSLNNKSMRVARFILGLTDPKIWALHRCDNPPCVEESHLFSGTAQDNSDDKVAKGRHLFQVTEKFINSRKRGESHGMSKLTQSDVNQIRTRARIPAKGFRKEWATEFGVSVATIADILGNRSWV